MATKDPYAADNARRAFIGGIPLKTATKPSDPRAAYVASRAKGTYEPPIQLLGPMTPAQRAQFAGISPEATMTPAAQKAAVGRSAAQWAQLGQDPQQLGLGAHPAPTFAQILDALPKVDPSSYTKPYDDATAAAKAAYIQAQPQIKGAYDGLRGQIQAGSKDVGSQFDALGAGAQTRTQQLAQALQDRQNQTSAALTANGVDTSLLAGTQASARDQYANLLQSGGDESAYLGRLKAVAQQGNQDRISDTGLAEANAQSNASTNLAQMVSQLGLDRAGAAHQAQKDTFSQGTTLAKAKADYISKQAESQAKLATEHAKQVKALQSNPHAEFVQNFGALRQQHPEGTKAFQELIQHAGTGPLAKEKALQALEAWTGDLTSGRAVTATGQKIAARVNPQTLAQWVEAYYDKTTPTLNEAARAQLGL